MLASDDILSILGATVALAATVLVLWVGIVLVLAGTMLVLTIPMARRAAGTRHAYRLVSWEDFPDLDLAFYQRTQAALEGLGFRILGDVENLTMSKWARNFVRHMASSDGLTMAEVYDVRLQGWMSALLRVSNTPADFRTIEFTSELSDSTFVVTANTLGGDKTPPPEGARFSRHPRSTPPQELLTLHSEAVEEWLRERPGVSLVPHLTLEEDVAACHRMQDLRIAQYRKRGFLGVFGAGLVRRQ